MCDALLLPEDDLAFAQYLASPLGGLTDASLMELALSRRGRLVSVLFSRAAEAPGLAGRPRIFRGLAQPRGLFHAVRPAEPRPWARSAAAPDCLQRLGAEAAEPIDELLAEALAFAVAHPARCRISCICSANPAPQIKREAEAGGDVVRIMTVHGAKGLQAPIVILPDTTGLPNTREKLFWLRCRPNRRDGADFLPAQGSALPGGGRGGGAEHTRAG